MKKSKHIDVGSLRKSLPDFRLKRISLAIAAFSLIGCSQKEEVKVVGSVDECIAQTTLSAEDCKAAYQRALDEAEKTGPKYRDRRLCEADFGHSQCRQSSSGIFMPLMAGFMIGQMLNNRPNYYNPVYHYQNPYSSSRGKIMTADGSVVGRPGQSSYNVGKQVTKPKARVTKTVSRGGFGSKASAKSSWGGGKSARGWGG